MAVRLGVIGLGYIGQIHIANIRLGKARCKLVAVADSDEKRLDAFKDILTFKDAGEMIHSGAVDAVLIATPHYAHTTVGIEALKAGLHVLVEKPVSVHKADGQKLMAAHTNPKQVFSAMFQMRAEPCYQSLKRLIASGELGEIRRTSWMITDWFRPDCYYGSAGWRATWAGEGGGVLINQCPHNLDLFQWLCGMPSRVRAFCHFGKHHAIEVEDEVTAYLEYPNGATGVFVTTTGEAPGVNRLEIAGERGLVVLENGRITFTRNETPTTEFKRTTKDNFSKPDVWVADIPFGGPGEQHIAILRNFCDAILDGKPLIAPAEEGLNSVELANAMLFSTWTDKTVDMPLNGKAYEKKLNEMIAKSKRQK